MQADFWHQRWQDNQIAFHEKHGNRMLVEHFNALALMPDSRIFLPLCGKTLDIGWLLSQGYRVAGAELSELAIQQLFEELGISPAVSNVSDAGSLKHYRAPNIDMFVGDIFELSSDVLGPVDAIYDRAALVALPDAMRARYVSHLTEITATAPQLLVCFEYDQSLMEGPPFSIDASKVAAGYKDRYDITLAGRAEVPGKLKGRVPAMESAWHLKARG